VSVGNEGGSNTEERDCEKSVEFAEARICLHDVSQPHHNLITTSSQPSAEAPLDAFVVLHQHRCLMASCSDKAAQVVVAFFEQGTLGDRTGSDSYDNITFDEFRLLFPERYRWVGGCGGGAVIAAVIQRVAMLYRSSQHVRALFGEYKTHRKRVRAQLHQRIASHFAQLHNTGANERADANELHNADGQVQHLDSRIQEARSFLTEYVAI
jgi:hypothetical protein